MIRALVVSVFSSMSLGAALAAVQPVVLGDAPDPLSVEVPAGRIGDHVAYRYYETAWPEPELGTRLDQYVDFQAHLWVPRHSDSFKVNGTGRALDRAGVPQDTVQVLHSGHKDRNPAVYDVDAATREVLRRVEVNGTSSQATGSWSDYSYGPLRSGLGQFEEWPLLYQGRTFTLGDRLRMGEERFRDQWLGLYEERRASRGAVRLVSLEQTVDAPLVVGGHQTVSVQTRGEIVFDFALEESLGMGSDRDGRDGLYFLRFYVPRQSRILFTENVWLASESAYPVLAAARIVVNDTLMSQWMGQLILDEPGDAPIPWKTLDPGPGTGDRNGDWERSGSTRSHPADGAASNWPLPLSVALQAVEADPPPAYRVWRLSHPVAYLITAEWSERAGGEGWWLVMADGLGAGYVIWVAGNSDVGVVRAHDDDEISTQKFDPSALPRNLVTIGELERLWAVTLPPQHAGLRPNRFVWGSNCDWGGLVQPACEPAIRRTYNGVWVDSVLDGARRATIGYSRPDETDYLMGELQVNVDQGVLQYSYVETSSRPLAGLPSIDKPVSRPKTTEPEAPSPPMPQIQTFAVATVSLLFILLTTYFFPLLKYVAVKIPIALRGYAKLRRVDLLENPVREQLLGAIRADPGVSPPELHRRVGGGWSTVVYHLDVLEKNQLVSSLIHGRNRCFFPRDTVNWGQRAQIAVLKNARTRRLFEFISQNPGHIQRDLANVIGVSFPAARWHARRLAEAGLVREERTGGRLRYFAQGGLPPAGVPAPVPVAAT